MLLAKYQNIDSVPWEGRFNSLFGFTALKLRVASGASDWFSSPWGDAFVPIRPFLGDQNFDPETTRLMGIAFETVRAAIKRPGDLTDEMIARKIIDLAKAGERDVEALGKAALNLPA